MPLPAQLAPTVEATGAPGVFRRDQASPDAFGAQVGAAQRNVGAALGTAGNVAAEAALNFQRQQNETDVDAANINYDQQRRAALFDEDGFYNKKGKAAFDAMGPTATSIEQLRNETRASLKNPQQQRMFDVMSRRNTENDLRSMSMHAAQENQKYRVGVTEAGIANAQTDAAIHWNDPVRFSRELGTIALQAENRARLMGQTDPEQIKAAVQHYTSQAWDQRFRAAFQRDPKLANAMYEANPEVITDPTARTALEHLLKIGVMPVDARQDAEAAMTGPKTAPAGSPGELPGAARAVKTSAATGAESDDVKNHETNIAALKTELSKSGQTPANLKVLQKELSDEQALLDQARKGGAAASGEPAANAGTAGGQSAPLTSRDTHAMLAAWIPEAERLAEQRHPGDPVYRDMVITQVKGKVATIAAMQEGIERKATDTLKGIILGAGGQPKPITVDDLMRNPDSANAMALLPPSSLQGVMSLLRQNGREAAGEFTRSNPALVNDLRQRIYLPDGDPRKLTSPTQITPYFADGLNYTDSEHLRKELAEANTPEGNPFLKHVNGIKSTAYRMLTKSMSEVTLMNPEMAEEAAYRFNADLDNKMKAAREKGGTAMDDLFTPGSKTYVLDPNRVAGFMPTQAQIVARRAEAARKPADVPQRQPNETPADYLKRIGK